MRGHARGSVSPIGALSRPAPGRVQLARLARRTASRPRRRSAPGVRLRPTAPCRMQSASPPGRLWRAAGALWREPGGADGSPPPPVCGPVPGPGRRRAGLCRRGEASLCPGEPAEPGWRNGAAVGRVVCGRGKRSPSVAGRSVSPPTFRRGGRHVAVLRSAAKRALGLRSRRAPFIYFRALRLRQLDLSRMSPFCPSRSIPQLIAIGRSMPSHTLLVTRSVPHQRLHRRRASAPTSRRGQAKAAGGGAGGETGGERARLPLASDAGWQELGAPAAAKCKRVHFG